MSRSLRPEIEAKIWGEIISTTPEQLGQKPMDRAAGFLKTTVSSISKVMLARSVI